VKQSIVRRLLRVAVQRTGGNVADVDVTIVVTTAASSLLGKHFIIFMYSLL